MADGLPRPPRGPHELTRAVRTRLAGRGNGWRRPDEEWPIQKTASSNSTPPELLDPGRVALAGELRAGTQRATETGQGGGEDHSRLDQALQGPLVDAGPGPTMEGEHGQARLPSRRGGTAVDLVR